MANRIKAINALRPRLKLGPTVQFRELTALISSRTGLTSSQVLQVLLELRDTVAFYHLTGRGVKLDGLGTYLPNIGLDGTFNVEHRLDRDLKARLNDTESFAGTIVNRRRIGKTAAELVALWDELHPDDPVER
jgi:hypothetical protein